MAYMTPKQERFLDSLLTDRVCPEQNAKDLRHRMETGLSKDDASKAISWLLDQPRKDGGSIDRAPAAPDPEVLPAGRYAIENEEGDLRFYKLWRGDRKPTYFKLYVLHGPDDSEVPFRSALSILGKIVEAGPGECAIRFGHEIGECSTCGARLTNNLSRELGIGPVCGGRFYPDETWTERKAEARADLRARGIDPAASYDPTMEAAA